MPSTRIRSVKVQSDALRGSILIPTGEQLIEVMLNAADFTGATSGRYVFISPGDMVFLGATEVHSVVGTNSIRVKKVPAAATQAPGAAADANNIDLTAAIDVTLGINVARDVAPITTLAAHRLSAGDKVALASTAGTTGLVGLIVLRFGFV